MGILSAITVGKFELITFARDCSLYIALTCTQDHMVNTVLYTVPYSTRMSPEILCGGFNTRCYTLVTWFLLLAL